MLEFLTIEFYIRQLPFFLLPLITLVSHDLRKISVSYKKLYDVVYLIVGVVAFVMARLLFSFFYAMLTTKPALPGGPFSYNALPVPQITMLADATYWFLVSFIERRWHTETMVVRYMAYCLTEVFALIVLFSIFAWLYQYLPS